MKISHIIALVLIAVGIAVMVTTLSDSSQYVTFKEADALAADALVLRSPDGGRRNGIASDALRLRGCGVFAEGFFGESSGFVGRNSLQRGPLRSVYTSLPCGSEHTHVPATEAPPTNTIRSAAAQAVLE